MTGLSRDNRRLAISLLFWGFGEGLFILLGPLYMQQLGADPVMIGNIFALTSVSMILAYIPVGYLADRFGRKQLFYVAWALGVLAGLIMFLAPNLLLFVVGWVMYVFTGFVSTPMDSYITEARGEQSVQRAMTMMSASYATGMLISPTIGGWIAQQFGLRMIFGAATFVFVLSTLAMLQLQAQPVVPVKHGESRYSALFHNRRFIGFVGLMFLALLAMYVGIPLMQNFVQNVYRYDVNTIGTLGSMFALGGIVLNYLIGNRSPRLGFMAAQALMALSFGLLLLSREYPILALAFFFRAAWNLARMLAKAQVGRVVAPGELGMALGITETAIQLAMMFAPMLAGWLYAQTPTWPFYASLGLIAVTLPFVWWFAPKQDAHTEQEKLGELATIE